MSENVALVTDSFREDAIAMSDVALVVEEPATGLRHTFVVRLPTSIGADTTAGICVARDFLLPVHGFFGAEGHGVSFWCTDTGGDATIDGKRISAGGSFPFGERTRLMLGGRIRVSLIPVKPAQEGENVANPFAVRLNPRAGLGGATAADHLHPKGVPSKPATPPPERLASSDAVDGEGHLHPPAPTAEAHHLPRGAHLGRHQIIDVIFDGGMGTVYRAQDPVTKRKVAIKTLAPDLVTNPEAHERLINEAGAAAALDSAHIVNVLDVAMDSHGNPYIVMELLKGVDLAERIASVGRLPLTEATKIICEVLKGLGAAHRVGIIHRDIKPKNIHCSETSDGEVTKVLDFGVARRTRGRDPQLTANGAIVGTTYYMSPEQAKGEELDNRSDIFSVGVVFFECLTGKRPFEGNSSVAILAKIVTGDRPRLRELVPGINPALEEIVDKALSVRRDDRYHSVEEMGAALARFAPEEHRELLSKHFSAPRPLTEQLSSTGFEMRSSRFLRPAPTNIPSRSPHPITPARPLLNAASQPAPARPPEVDAAAPTARATPRPSDQRDERDERDALRAEASALRESAAETPVPVPQPAPKAILAVAEAGNTRTFHPMLPKAATSDEREANQRRETPAAQTAQGPLLRASSTTSSRTARSPRRSEKGPVFLIAGIAALVGLAGSFSYLSLAGTRTAATAGRPIAREPRTAPEASAQGVSPQDPAPAAPQEHHPARGMQGLQVPPREEAPTSRPAPEAPMVIPPRATSPAAAASAEERTAKHSRHHRSRLPKKPDASEPKIQYGNNQVPLI